jgi:hypothetical protein
MSNRQFDIGWVRQSEAAQEESDGDLLLAFREQPENPRHVVDLARTWGMEFDSALTTCYRLISRGYLDVDKRDEVAGDHLLRLSERGRKRFPNPLPAPVAPGGGQATAGDGGPTAPG